MNCVGPQKAYRGWAHVSANICNLFSFSEHVCLRTPHGHLWLRCWMNTHKDIRCAGASHYCRRRKMLSNLIEKHACHMRHARDRHDKYLRIEFGGDTFHSHLIANMEKKYVNGKSVFRLRDHVHNGTIEQTIWSRPNWCASVARKSKYCIRNDWAKCDTIASRHSRASHSMTPKRKRFRQFVKANIFGHFFSLRRWLVLCARAPWRCRMTP